MAGNPTDSFQVGPVSIQDNLTVNARATNDGALVVQEINGKYAELVRRGYVFAARLGTAQAIPCIATLSNGYTLFNRSSANKIVYPLILNLSLVAPPATLASTWQGLAGGFIYGCGDAPAAGAPLSTAGTAITGVNMLAGSTPTPTSQVYATMIYSSPYAATFPTTQMFDLGINTVSNGTLASAGGYFIETASYDLQGMVGPFALKPGTAFVIGTNLAGGTGSITWNQTVVWAEIPIGSAVLP